MESNLILILFIVLIALILAIALVSIFSYINRRKKNKYKVDLSKVVGTQKKKMVEVETQSTAENKFKDLIKENEILSKELKLEIENYKILNGKLESKINEEIVKLERLSGVSNEHAKVLLLEKVEQNLQKQKSELIKSFNDSQRQEIEEKTINLMLEIMERSVEDVVLPKTSFTIKLKDDNIKGRIIGKDGRNKKSFEATTGVDLIIEKEPELTLSSLNPIRRELARQLLVYLLDAKSIEPSKIEKQYKQIEEDFNSTLYQKAAEVLEGELEIFDVDHEFYKTIGRLAFRTSFGQNILQHSRECALLASSIASELGLDPIKAKKAAFFHDIGKANDFEIDNDHVETGLKLAHEFKFENYIINAIESHHDKVPADNYYSAIVKIVDKISASRPGARFISHEEYIKRITTIEEICNDFSGVKNSYAVKAGKQVRVIVNPSVLSDEESEALSFDIKNKLESNEIVNKQPIEIIIIRENRFEIKSGGSAQRKYSD